MSATVLQNIYTWLRYRSGDRTYNFVKPLVENSYFFEGSIF